MACTVVLATPILPAHSSWFRFSRSIRRMVSYSSTASRITGRSCRFSPIGPKLQCFGISQIRLLLQCLGKEITPFLTYAGYRYTVHPYPAYVNNFPFGFIRHFRPFLCQHDPVVGEFTAAGLSE